MTEKRNDFGPLDFTDGERVLMAHLAAILSGENAVPQHVEEAAKALHDWAIVDETLADLSAAPVLTRGDDAAFTFDLGTVQVRAEVEPSGFRRRQLSISVDDAAGLADVKKVSLQFPDGRSQDLAPDRFGEYAASVPSGALRVIAVLGGLGRRGALHTAWFTV